MFMELYENTLYFLNTSMADRYCLNREDVCPTYMNTLQKVTEPLEYDIDKVLDEILNISPLKVNLNLPNDSDVDESRGENIM